MLVQSYCSELRNWSEWLALNIFFLFQCFSTTWQKHWRILEARHEIMLELVGHCHESQHLFISSRNYHKGICVGIHTAKTKLLWPIGGTLEQGSMSGLVVAPRWGSRGLPEWAAGSCAWMELLLYKYTPPNVRCPASAGWHRPNLSSFC